jgi:hypothetical protein
MKLILTGTYPEVLPFRDTEDHRTNTIIHYAIIIYDNGWNILDVGLKIRPALFPTPHSFKRHSFIHLREKI